MKWVMKLAEKGDMVRVKLGSIYHYGVFVSEDEIIQFGLAPSLRSAVKDSDIEVCTSDVDLFLAGGFLEVAEFDRFEKKKNRSVDEAVEYARSRLGERGYSILYNNCEHFAYECITGNKYCSQTETVRSFFKSLPLLNVYCAQIPENLSIETVEPPERNREISEIADEQKRREEYFAWKMLEYALEHSICFRAKKLKRTDTGWSSEKCEFDICIRDTFVAVAISRTPVSLALFRENDVPASCKSSEKCRVESLSVDGAEFVLSITNNSPGALKLYTDVKF